MLNYIVGHSYSSGMPMLAATYSTHLSGVGALLPVFVVPILFVIAAAVLLLIIVSVAKVYMKAGKSWWSSIIPIYNIVVLLQIVGRPVWFVLFIFVPWLNLLLGVFLCYELARVFGKGIGFTIGLIVLPVIFYPILAFGKAVYNMSGAHSDLPPIPSVPTA